MNYLSNNSIDYDVLAKRWHAMWIGSVGLFAIIAISLPLSKDMDRDGLPIGPTKLVYTEDFSLSSIDFYFDTTSDPHTIQVQTISNITNRKKPASITIAFPFNGTLSKNSGWEIQGTDHFTLITKEFHCSSENPCSFSDSEQFFEIILPVKIDRAQSFSHSIEFSFGDGAPPPEVLNKLKPERYETGFSSIISRAILLIDKKADRFDMFPPGEKPLARENQQINWNFEGGKIYSVDYEIPLQRQIENNYGLILGLTGIALGVFSLGLYSIEQSKKEKNR